MTKRKRELHQRLTELFSDSAAPAPDEETPPAPPEAAATSAPQTRELVDNALLKTVLDNLPQPAYIKDDQHSWVAVNPAFADWLGVPAGSLPGHVDKEQSDEAWQLDDQVLTSGQPNETQETFPQADGSIRTRRIRRVPLTSGDRRYVLATIEETLKVVSAADAERTALLDELAEQRANADRFQTIAEATPVPVLVTRLADGRPLYANSRACEMFGAPLDEVLRHTASDFYDDPNEHSAVLALLKRDGRVDDYELRLKRPDGQRRWVSLSMQPITLHGQSAMLSSFYDISRRKSIEEQLRDSEALYQALVEDIPENLCRKDAQGRFTYGNKKYCQDVGLSLSELIGKTDYDIHPPELAEQYRADDQRVMAEGKVSSTVEAHTVLGSNEISYVRTLKTPVYDRDGRATGVQILFWDVSEQVRAERDLEIRTSALEAAADGIAITDRDGSIVWINQAFTRITGYSPAEALGQNPRILKSGRQPREYYQRMWRTILAGEVWSDELTNRRKDGTEYVEDLTITPVRNAAGDITHFIAVQRDVTQRKREEAERLRTSEVVRILLDTVPDTIFVKNARSEFVLVNRATARQNGAASPEEMIGKTDFDFHSPELAARFQADEQALLRSGRPMLAREETVIDPDGNVIHLLTSKVPYRNAAGEIEGLIGIGRDITALKRAEEEVARSERLMRTLIDAMPDYIYAKDAAGRFVLSNLAHAQLRGLASDKDLIGKTDFDFYPPELAEQFAASERAILQDGQALIGHEEPNIDADGRPHWNLTTKVPFRDSTGQIVGLVGITHDITDRKQAEEALRRNEAQLAEALRIAQLANWEYDVASDTFTFNDQFYALLRTTAEAEGGYTMSSARYAQRFVHPEDAPIVGQEIATALATTDPHYSRQIDHRIFYADGEPGYFSVRFYIEKDAAGRTVKTFGANQDITERKRAEAERERLLAEQQRRAVQVQTGAEIAAAASTILNVDELLPVVVELIRERFDLYYVGLFLTDEQNENALLQAGTGEAGRKMLENGHRLPIGGTSMIGRCVATGEARIALDVGAEAVRFENPLLPQTRSEMALPLISRGQTIGAITIQSTQLRAFQPDDIAALQTMARQIAIAIDNARLLGEFSRQTAELTTLNKVGNAVSQNTSASDLLQAVLKITLDAAGFESGIATFLSEAAGGLQLLADINMPSALLEVIRAQGLSGTLCEYVFNTGEQLSLTDLRHNAPVPVDGLIALGLVSYTGVPLVYREQRLGTLCMFSRTPRRLTAETAALLTAIGSQIGVGLENVNLLAQANLRANELAALNELSEALSSRLDVPQVVEQVYQGISRLLDTSNFYIGVYDAERNEVTFMINATQSAVDRAISSMPADRGLTGYIIRTRQSLLIKEDVTGWQEKMGIARVGDAAHSWLGVPLMVGDQILGVMAIQSYSADRSYTDHDRDLMQAIGSQAAIALQNARLFEQTQTALAETERLYAASRQLFSAPDWQAMLAAVAEVLPQPVINRASLLLFDTGEAGDIEAANLFVAWHSGRGLPPLPIGTRYPIEVFQSLHLVNGRQPFIFNNVAADPRVDEVTRQVLVQQNTQAMVAVPLWAGDRQLGVLLLESEDPHDFSAADARLFDALSQQLALSIENRQLFEQSQRRVSELQALNEIGQAAAAQLDLTTLLQHAGKAALRALGVNTGYIALFDERTQQIEFPFYRDEGRPVQNPPRPVGEGLTSTVIRQRQPLLINHLTPQVLAELGGVQMGTGDLQQSWLGVPMLSGDQTLGMLNVQAPSANRFTADDVNLLTTIAASLGTAIRGARLYEETQRTAARERTLNRIATQIRTAQSVEQVLAVAARELRLATGAAVSVAELNTGPAESPGNGHTAQPGGEA